MSVVKVIFWRGWRIRWSERGERWWAHKPRYGSCFAPSGDGIGKLISMILMSEVGYRGAGFLDRGRRRELFEKAWEEAWSK